MQISKNGRKLREKAFCPDPDFRQRRVWTKARTRQHKIVLIGSLTETFSVATMGVSDPDRSPVGINC
jgi:hypothetical protein